MAPSYIPTGPLDTVDVDNTSPGRAQHGRTLDQAAAWLVANRRLQQPVAWAKPRTGNIVIYRYQTVLLPPGSTHVAVSCLYSGGNSAGPTFDLSLNGGAPWGTASTLPKHVPDAAVVISGASWAGTSWAATKDTPVAGGLGHLNVVDDPKRVPDEWQIATVRMTFSPSGTSYQVHAWTCEPVFLDPTEVP
jgi:hypothetical protein